MASDTESSIGAELEWPEIESIVAELATLSRADISLEELAAELLDRSLRLLAAVGGSVWLADRPGSLQLVNRGGREVLGPACDEPRRRARIKVLETRVAQVARIDTDSCDGRLDRREEWLLIISPVVQDGHVAGLFEIVQRPTLDEDVLRGNRRLMELVCQSASDYLGRCELRTLRHAQLQALNLGGFVQKLHRSLDLTTVAYELANEGRRLVGCDRLSVALRHGRRFRLLAMSGVDTIERRSNAVRRLEELVSAAAMTGEPVWYAGEEHELPPQIFEPLQLYLDEAHVRSCGILPLRAPAASGEVDRGPAFAALVVEQFGGVADRGLREAAQSVADQGELALLNGLRYQALPTLPFARHRDVLVRSSLVRSRTAWAAAAAAGLLAALCFVPGDFGVYAEGRLQPQKRQEVFAPMDGRVTRLAVQHGEQVKSGSTLVELSSPELDVAIQKISGEYDTARKRLSVVQSTLLEAGTAKDRDSTRAGQLAAEQEELTKLLESQRLQLELLAKERMRLVVRSPMDGAVLTWDIEQLLADRPVERGQSLVAIGDLAGRWNAEIDVPDNQIGYLLEAQSAAERPLTASFQLATDRRHAYQGTVRQIGAGTELNDAERPVVRVTVDFDESAMRELRPGATVFARVDCGRKPLGYVWFHQLIETIRGWAFYWTG